MTAKLFLIASFVLSMLLMSYNRRRKKRIVFFGDSITEQGNRAGGYIKRMKEYLAKEELDEKYELIGSGVGGNKITDLWHRLSRDILSKGADVVVLFIGVNDVWHKLHNNGTPANEFDKTYRQLIEKLQSAEIKVLLSTPAVIGEKTEGQNVQDAELDLYCNIVRQLTHEYNLPLCDLRKAFTAYILQHNIQNFYERGILTTDGVHLNDEGNKLVAKEMWNALAPILVTA